MRLDARGLSLSPFAPRKHARSLRVVTVSLGSVVRPLTSDDDLLGEMPEGRQ